MGEKFQMNRQGLNGTEIADKLGISKQAVSFALRKAMNKMYYEIKKQNYAESPFDIVMTLMEMLQVNRGSVNDMKEFISLFSKSIQKEIKTDAIMNYNV
jgi:predicted transcriptional regulator